MLTRTLVKRAKRKAKQSYCRYKIAAIGLNKRGEVIASAMNKPRFNKKGGGLHAEMSVMREAGPALRTILLCRVNPTGNLCKIDPCEVCKNKAEDLGVTIVTLGGDDET